MRFYETSLTRSHQSVCFIMFGFVFCCFSFLLYFCQICVGAETNCTYEQVVRHKIDKDENDIGYRNESDESIRATHWCHTDNHIQEHNSKNTSYKLTHNWLSHKTPEEMDKFNSLVDTVPLDIDDLTSATAGSKMKTARFQRAKKCVPRPPPPVTWKVPDSINWTAKGLLLAPKDQGHCGSCYSFASAPWLPNTNLRLVKVSQENIIDCADDYCGGGNVIETFQYIGENGLHTDEVYPYTSYKVKVEKSTQAVYRSSRKAFPVVKRKRKKKAEKRNKRNKSGIKAEKRNKRNHAVLVVGYGTNKVTGLDYWIVKKSWGGWKPKKCQPDGRCIKHYDQGGYVLMRRGVAMCAIGTEAAVPQ